MRLRRRRDRTTRAPGARPLLVAVAALLVACTSSTGSTASHVTTTVPQTPCQAPVSRVVVHLDTATLDRVRGLLRTLAEHAWNPDAPPAKGSVRTGGLYVNWRASWDGTTPAEEQTNIRTTGVSDADANAPSRHDPLTDLLILRGADAYLATGAGDPPVLRLACLLRPVVEAEFAAYGVDRGWIYGQLIDLSRLDWSGPWLATAERYATLLSTRYVDPVSGAERDPGDGTYRSDYAAETAAALVDAGSRFVRPDWTAQGERAASYLVQRAADPRTGFYAGKLRLNTAGEHDTVVDPLVKVGAQAQLLDSLLQVFDRTRDAALLQAVQTAMSSLDSPATGLVDTRSGGFYFAVDVDGSGLRPQYKETRQAWLLPLLQHLAAEGDFPVSRVQQFQFFVRDELFRAEGGGYAYRVAPDLGAYTSTVGGVTIAETWISTEATGIALVALTGSVL